MVAGLAPTRIACAAADVRSPCDVRALASEADAERRTCQSSRGPSAAREPPSRCGSSTCAFATRGRHACMLGWCAPTAGGLFARFWGPSGDVSGDLLPAAMERGVESLVSDGCMARVSENSVLEQTNKQTKEPPGGTYGRTGQNTQTDERQHTSKGARVHRRTQGAPGAPHTSGER